MHPEVDAEALWTVLSYQPKYLLWAGADLMYVTTEHGKRQMVVIETNSCPSGQKSMPLIEETQDQGGYRTLLERTFLPRLTAYLKDHPVTGGLAVVYDKNVMEAEGYACAMAELFQEKVYLIPFMNDDPEPPVRFVDSLMQVWSKEKEGWVPIRGCLRYVTQKPWNRLPVKTSTFILNPIISCLAGGRNKMVAAKAYDQFNVELSYASLGIRTPVTIRDVAWDEIAVWVNRLGGHAVIKIPYSNAGQGVYTITNETELKQFFKENPQGSGYDKFIVQSLIGNYKWSSREAGKGGYYHVGTIPNQKGEIFVADLRMQVSAGVEGYELLGMYARRTAVPLLDQLTPGVDSWSMLGTNLSVKLPDGQWDTETSRLLLMDRKDFNSLGMGVDDLIDGFIQTVLAAIAIDRMCSFLITSEDGFFSPVLFRSVNDDPTLLKEILLG